MLTSPIKCSERFEIVLVCDFNHFKVIINERHSCKFLERIHYDRISHLAIDGDVSIIKISYETNSPNRPIGTSSSNSTAPTASFEELEPVSVRTSTSSSRRMRPSSVPEASAPPSYDEATSGSLKELSSRQPTPKNPPYPINDATGMPVPTVGINSSPSMSRGGSAPIGINVPLDRNRAYGYGASPSGTFAPLNAYSPAYLPPPPPPGAPVPLNAPNSNFRPLRRVTMKHYCIIFFVIASFVFLFTMIGLVAALR
ncbi:hypothetical protein ILUMI_09051 [Ignelater luminosus]|uniref:Galectin n=1 Tax=Ignelater luminosus TaxID=2038154 RepID=A0A8K0DA26_IGNLU|nr:hypothetical protein ILUMI_09051 [Ignelater luminosus]